MQTEPVDLSIKGAKKSLAKVLEKSELNGHANGLTKSGLAALAAAHNGLNGHSKPDTAIKSAIKESTIKDEDAKEREVTVHKAMSTFLSSYVPNWNVYYPQLNLANLNQLTTLNQLNHHHHLTQSNHHVIPPKQHRSEDELTLSPLRSSVKSLASRKVHKCDFAGCKLRNAHARVTCITSISALLYLY